MHGQNHNNTSPPVLQHYIPSPYSQYHQQDPQTASPTHLPIHSWQHQLQQAQINFKAAQDYAQYCSKQVEYLQQQSQKNEVQQLLEILEPCAEALSKARELMKTLPDTDPDNLKLLQLYTDIASRISPKDCNKTIQWGVELITKIPSKN